MSEPFEIIGDSSDRAAWLAARRQGIGASDAPALLGLSPWASPSSVQADKWGLLDEPDEAEVLKWGRLLEPGILRGLSEEVGIELQVYGRLLRSREHPWMLCTPDGADEEERIFAQVKNTVRADEWTETPPPRVWVQCQHELAVTGREKMIAAALILGNRLRWAWVERDETFIAETLIPTEREFWRSVEAQEPAAPDASDATKRALQSLYPEDTGESVPLDGHFLDLDEARVALLDEKRGIEAQLQGLDNELRAAIKDATYGVLPNGVRYSLRKTERKAYTVAATTYRALRRLKAKE